MELSDYRQQIDGIDSQLLALFYQRMEVAAQIAGYKKAHNLPALDAGRERAKLQQIADAAPEDLREYAVSLYSLIFELSRSCQNRLLGVTSPLTAEIEQAIARTPQLFPEHPAVACQGVEGAYSQLACDRLFTMPNVFYCATFEAVFAAIEKGLCRYGVIPLENSTAGSVNAVYDLMMQHNFRIVRSVRLKIDHCLLAKPGTKLSDIKEIYSHEQAISQCGRFLQSLPGQKIIMKGNHDYWWSTANKMNAYLKAEGFDTLHILHNNSTGSRAWPPPCRIRATTTRALSASPRISRSIPAPTARAS